MSRRTFSCLLLFSRLTALSCRTNQGNGVAQPENTGKGYNPDQEKNNVRQSGTGGPGQTNRSSQPGSAQTPSQPASKGDRTP